MKTFQILFAVLFAFTTSFTFGQNQINTTLSEKKDRIINPNSIQTNPFIYTVACEYEDCDQATNNAFEQYRILANERCQEVAACIICCSGDFETYVYMVIKPDSPDCKKASQPNSVEPGN